MLEHLVEQNWNQWSQILKKRFDFGNSLKTEWIQKFKALEHLSRVAIFSKIAKTVLLSKFSLEAVYHCVKNLFSKFRSAKESLRFFSEKSKGNIVILNPELQSILEISQDYFV